jgi:predicted permease
MVLLLACLNLSNFLLSRAVRRQKELALRLAVGASRSRLLRQMLAESFVLASAGAAAGVLFAAWSSRMLIALLQTNVNYVNLEVQLNSRVLLYSGALALLAILLFGSAPAIRAVRSSLQPLLKEGSHQLSARHAWSRSLLIAQVALSLLLTLGATYFVGTFRNLVAVHPGFDADRVLVAHVQPIRVGIENETAAAFYRDVTARIARVPGVEAVAVALMTPIQDCCWWDPVEVDGYTPAPGERLDVFFNSVSPDYFRTLGTPVLRGRLFSDRDTPASTPAAIVNEAFARKFFSGREPLGQWVTLPQGYGTRRFQIVGVVGNINQRDVRSPIPLMLYFGHGQQQKDLPGTANFMVRTRGNPASLGPAVRRAVHQTNPGIPVSLRTLSDELNDTMTHDRLLALLSGFFGVVALALAAIGLYGVLAYTVARRTSEIGVRVALGAPRAKVLWLVVRQSAVLVCAGMAIGSAAGLGLGRFIESLLFGVDPADPSVFAAALSILGAVTLLAAWLPARRATAIDPVKALRYE